ncbi:hypothetical protein A9Q91_05720 [Candidatus Gracilibacteria bacterium 28_42_T64]|nr:hypothetical protein A9Q91_05720 [Candidatus Gracilibacteria bacterium 28_42_T64]
MTDIYYSWKFEDKKNRSSLWYVIALSIVIGLIIWGFLTKQYGMSFIVLLIAGITYFIENNSDDEIEVLIGELGVKIGGSFYEYSRINSYSMIYNGENALLLRLNMNKQGLRNIDLMVNNDIATQLNKILPSLLEENPKGELSLSEKIIHLLKL